MRYDDTIRFLFGLESFGIKLGLDNIHRFVDRLGHPERAFASIHVAGTNGKGTVCSTIAAVLTTAGYKTGLFTSPHLVDFRERIRVDGAQVPRREVARFVAAHREFIRANKITFFEATTAMAFDWFTRFGCDVAVVEVGMGGRLDATNVVTPVLSVITSIDLDHTGVLGNTRSKVAREKAGIIKAGIPVVSAPMAPAARKTIARIAARHSAPLVDAERLVSLHPIGDSAYEVKTGGKFPRCVRWAYRGGVYEKNLQTVIGALIQLRRSGFRLTDRDIRHGLAAARWPGRFQVQPGRPPVVYDVAHNAAAARWLAEMMRDFAGGRQVTAVCAVAEDKDWRKMIRSLAPHVGHWCFSKLPHARSWRLSEVAGFAHEQALSFSANRSPARAFSQAKAATPRDGLILVFGSHFLVGALIPRALIDPAPLAGSS